MDATGHINGQSNKGYLTTVSIVAKAISSYNDCQVYRSNYNELPLPDNPNHCMVDKLGRLCAQFPHRHGGPYFQIHRNLYSHKVSVHNLNNWPYIGELFNANNNYVSKGGPCECWRCIGYPFKQGRYIGPPIQNI